MLENRFERPMPLSGDTVTSIASFTRFVPFLIPVVAAIRLLICAMNRYYFSMIILSFFAHVITPASTACSFCLSSFYTTLSTLAFLTPPIFSERHPLAG